eukprot:Nk52_evm14s248 gene=Nk52_evmTU14s248
MTDVQREDDKVAKAEQAMAAAGISSSVRRESLAANLAHGKASRRKKRESVSGILFESGEGGHVFGKDAKESKVKAKAKAPTAEDNANDEKQMHQFMQLLQSLMVMQKREFDHKASEVLPQLFIGSIGAAVNKDDLQLARISHILNLCHPNDTGGESTLPVKPYENLFTYKVVECPDNPDYPLVRNHFKECFDFINDALKTGTGVLVHCFAGKSRSATVTIGYLIHQKSMTYAKAFRIVQKSRPEIEPNIGFIAQLKAFERVPKDERFKTK